jgi:outer membrane protein assembly factor BamB
VLRFGWHLYWTDEQSGLAYCVDAKTGKSVYQERLAPAPGRIYAAGVLAGGRIYYVSREKGTYVVKAKPKFELVAHNVIEDDKSVFNATPALEDGRIYLRSDKCLYCIGKK